MTDYTPTTADVRGKYATHQGARYRGKKYLDLRRAEFDRWLEQVKAEVWDEGHHAGQHNEHEYRPGRATTNPYRQGTETL